MCRRCDCCVTSRVLQGFGVKWVRWPRLRTDVTRSRMTSSAMHATMRDDEGAIALEARGVSKRYADRDALGGVDLVAEAGQLHGLLGPNGAGKTTLMRVLLGLVRRDAGTVRLLGRDLDSTAGPVADGVAGFVDTPAFYPYLSGRGISPCSIVSTAPRAPAAATRSTQCSSRSDLQRTQTSPWRATRPVCGSAWAWPPRCCDRRSSSFSTSRRVRSTLVGARDVRALARRLANEGAAVVLSSHDMAEVEELCSMLTVIDRGRVVFSGTVDDLRKLAPAAVHALRTSDDRAALDMASHRPGVNVAPAGRRRARGVGRPSRRSTPT